ncbi:MAG: sarcosine oxidase subunit gamma [Gemmobacter sp.]|nr:sarcosine oxidase subunit gamma [Gemmobacter sp.]
MPELIAKTPLSGLWPVTHGALSLSEVVYDSILSLAPFAGQEKVLTKALKPLGLAFPAPNTLAVSGVARIVWTGRDQAFLINAPLATPSAAITDQSDGWAGLRLEGPMAAEALMRLVPIDLRSSAFPPGSAARAPLNHMNAVVMRLESGFEVMVFRSMARSAWTEIAETMQRVAARQALR